MKNNQEGLSPKHAPSVKSNNFLNKVGGKTLGGGFNHDVSGISFNTQYKTQDKHNKNATQKISAWPHFQTITHTEVNKNQNKELLAEGPVKLDKNCLSCQGQPLHTIEAFKIACLQYKPGKVNYRANVMKREDLIVMRKTLLDKCEQIINHTISPFSENNLSTKKIFSDLMQYHLSEQMLLNPQHQGSSSVMGVISDQNNKIPRTSRNSHNRKQSMPVNKHSGGINIQFPSNLNKQNLNEPSQLSPSALNISRFSNNESKHQD